MNRFLAEPYPGARPFQRRDRDRFFGRAVEADTLVDLWRTNHLTILYGGTGTGKSSLLSAAVIPQLAEDDLDVLPAGRLLTSWTYPRAALPAHNPYTLGLLRAWSPAETVASLAGVSVRQFVSRRAERHGGRVFAAIDQAEELFASSEARRRAHGHAFLGELDEAVRSLRVHLLLSVREPAVELFTTELGGAVRYQLKPFNRSQAQGAAVMPVAKTSRSYAAGAVEKLVDNMMTGTVETRSGQERAIDLDHVDPVVLQVACARLWDTLPADLDVISERDIRQYGDVDAALTRHCSQLIATVAADYDIPAARLLAWLVRTFVTEQGLRGTACEGLMDTAGMPNPVLRALEDRHLLSTEQQGNRGTCYQLLSDRLTGPLQHATDTPPPPAEPKECLRAAGRALAVGEFILAQRWANDAVRISPGNDRRIRAEATSLLGNIEFEQDRPAQAEQHYRAAARLFEAVRDTAAVAAQLAAVGQMLLAQGKVADAVGILRAASDRVPNDLTVQTELGWALWSLGQRRAAVAVLTGVLAIDGGDAEALRVRGEILADLGDARDALRDLDRVVQDERPSTRAARGLARAELGEPGADKEIEGALEDAPRNGAVLLYAARAKALFGDRSAAMRLARYALTATDPALPQHQRAAAEELVGQASLDGP